MPGPLVHSPAMVLQYHLAAIGQGSLVVPQPWPIFVGKEPEIPIEVITLYDRAIFHKSRSMRDGEVAELYGIQIRLRTSFYAPGFRKIWEIVMALDALNNDEVTVPALSFFGLLPEKKYNLINFSRDITNRGQNFFLCLGKAKAANTTTDSNFTSNNDVFSVSGKLNLRMLPSP